MTFVGQITPQVWAPNRGGPKVGQLLYPRPFGEGIGWQDFLAGHALHTALVRRVRFYLTLRAAEDEVPVVEATLADADHPVLIAEAAPLARGAASFMTTVEA